MPSTDYEFVTHILARTDTLLRYFNSKEYPVPTRFTVEGTYEGLKEVDDLQKDSNFICISLILIIILTIIFFRSIKGPILVIASVLYACIPMLALFTAIFYGKLNPFTVFVATIILGIGLIILFTC